jgi:ribosomal-protein-alanine N-acetyltransferase
MPETTASLPTLETRRLLLRPLALDDAPAIQSLFPHWEIVRHLGDRIPWPYPDDGALIFVRDIALPAMALGTQWHWSLRLKTDPEQLIGVISLRDDPQENRGFWLGLPWQGQGLMQEAADAVTDFWFDALGREILRIPKAVANGASRRVSEKGGMRRVRQEMRNYVEGRLLSDHWEITALEWRAHRTAS